jgi:hypothetical protein
LVGDVADGNPMPRLTINGQEQELEVPDDMPLLWVLRDVVGLTGTKFGCGVALCGACTVHLDGRPIRSCITPVSNAVGKKITTIEAIGETESGVVLSRGFGFGRLRLLRTEIIPSRCSTSQHAIGLSAGARRASPVRKSKQAWCQGQRTVSPTRRPSPRGP